MHTRCLIHLIASFAAFSCGAQAGPPERLARLLNERAAWLKTETRCIRQAPDEYSGPRQFGYASVGGDHLQTDYGDEEGVVARNEQGQPLESGYGPFYSLRRGGDLWVYRDGDVHADLIQGVSPLSSIDARSFGIYCSPNVATLEDAIINPFGMGEAVQYSARSEDGKEVISAQNGSKSMSWYFDDERTIVPSRVAYFEGGRLMAESKSILGAFDGKVFPQRIEFYRFGYKGGVEPFEIMEIQTLDVNSTEMPDALDLAAIHIDAGIDVTIRQEGAMDHVEMRRWDGVNLVPLEVANEGQRSGRWTPGPHTLANRQRAQDLMRLRQESGRWPPPAPDVAQSTETEPATQQQPPGLAATAVSGWEAYTRRFIERYRLNVDQTSQAIRILRNCENEAHEWVQRHMREYDEYDSSVAKFRADQHEKTTDSTALDRSAAKLLKPLDDIFERTLKPRLDAIPTTQQRKDVEGVVKRKATSRPAAGG